MLSAPKDDHLWVQNATPTARCLWLYENSPGNDRKEFRPGKKVKHENNNQKWEELGMNLSDILQ